MFCLRMKRVRVHPPPSHPPNLTSTYLLIHKPDLVAGHKAPEGFGHGWGTAVGRGPGQSESTKMQRFSESALPCAPCTQVMKGITIQEPMASALVCGPKRVESHHFCPTVPPEGQWVAIHAGKSDRFLKDASGPAPWPSSEPCGQVCAPSFRSPAPLALSRY